MTLHKREAEIDWSKAPEGATHYLPEIKSWHPCWVKSESGNWYTMIADGFDARWDVDGDFEEAKHYIIPRPAPWTGDGLPPAGTVCEVLNNTLDNPAWERCTILFMGKFKAVYESESCHERVADVSESWMISFRALRTPAQIAAEEREKAIDEIAKILDGLWSSEREAAGFLYDAGYRKVEGGAQ